MPHPIPSPGEAGVDGFSVTPSDSAAFDPTPRALYIGTGGDVAITTPGGTVLTFKNVPDGGYVLCRCSKVMSTNTDAQDIVALY